MKSRVSQFSVHTNAKFALTLTLIYYREFIVWHKYQKQEQCAAKIVLMTFMLYKIMDDYNGL